MAFHNTGGNLPGSLPGEHMQVMETIQQWLVARLAQHLHGSASSIDIHEPFASYSLESVDAIALSGELEDWLGRELSPTLLYEYPTIEKLAGYLAVDSQDSIVQTNSALASNSGTNRELIAIVGMSCRFPGGATTPENFWRLLSNGLSISSAVPPERWDINAYYDPDPQAAGKMYTRSGAFLQDLAQFDAHFFGISPREAIRVDPQQRLLLEASWEAFERAGFTLNTLAGSSTGVFVGMMNNLEYPQRQSQHSDGSHVDDPYFGLGSASSIASGRLAYHFDLRGPTMTIDTACSSSLVALHLACQSLQNHECDLALVGGVHAIILPENMINACKMGMLSPDGRCKTFDAAADGFVLGEGCGVVVIKRLSEALADRHPILAVIRGSAVNQDGRSNGITAPNRFAQQAVIRQALSNAGISPLQVQYVEAHGSGTTLGDPIEVEALMDALGEGRSQDQRLLIGSVKTNIGHLAGAAGMAGLIKTVLALQHRAIPPHLNVQTRNPYIDWQRLPLDIVSCLQDWPTTEGSRIAGVSSFGWSGTNAHVILEEAPVEAVVPSERPAHLLILSAKTEMALQQATDHLADYLKEHPFEELANIAYTTQIGRTSFSHRRMLVCQNSQDALRLLTKHDQQCVLTGSHKTGPHEIAFLFPGLGELKVGLCQQLYQHEPDFRAIIDYCCSLLDTRLSLDLRSIFLSGETHIRPDASLAPLSKEPDLRALLGRRELSEAITIPEQALLNQTIYAQPLLFIIEYAIADLLRRRGIRPQALLGYSLGEYVAACVAGVFSLEDGLILVGKRAQMIQALPQGTMIAVALSEEEVRSYLSEHICLAAVNGPAACVLSGPTAFIEQLEQIFVRHEVISRRVETMHAFHSTMMAPLCESLTALLRGIPLKAPQIPFISNVSGGWITAEQATDPTYWARHLCQTVRLIDGIEQLLQKPALSLLEVGPGQAINSFIRQHPRCSSEQMSLIHSLLPSTYEQHTAYQHILTTLGKLWLTGVPVDWSGLYKHEQRLLLSLPTYPFERQRYWIDPPMKRWQASQLHVDERATEQHTQPDAQGKKPDIADWFYLPSWEKTVWPALADPSQLANHMWLVFVDTQGFGEQAAQQLALEGCSVVRVLSGTQFTQLDDTTFALQPHCKDDYTKLCQKLEITDLLPTCILHCWSVSGAGETVGGPAYFAEQQERGFYSLLFLTQALCMRGNDAAIRLLIISNHIQQVTGQEPLYPEKATLLAICKVITQEHPHIQCRSVDLNTALPTTEVVEQLLVECMYGGPDFTIAYRNDARWRQTYRPVRLQSTDSLPHLRPQGVYLITGGSGNIGMALAQYLAKTVQARVVLVGRSTLPPADTWSELLTTDSTDMETRRRIQGLQTLEAMGGEVLAVQADVADYEQMKQVIQQTIERFGTLHAVFHAAGILKPATFKSIQKIGPAECVQHFRPKVYGTFVLEQVLQGLTLDFCLLFSSISTILGGLGFAGYAASNTFLDAFVYKHNRTSQQPWFTVNWDTWRINALAEAELIQGRTVVQYAMNVDEGIEALNRILAARVHFHVINSTGDLSTRIRQWIQLDTLTDANTLEFRRDALEQVRSGERLSHGGRAQARPSETSGRMQSPTAHLSNSSDYERKVAEIWQQALGIERIGLYDNFFDLGGNSLIGMQVIARLKKAFHIHIPAVALFEAPTISALVRYLQPMSESVEPVQRQVLTERRQMARFSPGTRGIAIIGMAGRFPGAATLEQFWDNLRNGVESISFFSDEELAEAGVPPHLLQNPKYVKARPILTDIEYFDAAFFGYSPREAELLDPQHRLFLECAWEALELAGYDATTYDGLIGVFGGTNISTYLLSRASSILGSVDDYQIVISNDKDSLTTTVSYKLNLKGPSFAVQTFCSTSLVATHLACQSLLNGECDIALAGGVSVRVPSKGGHLYQEGGMESPDGHCRTFDAQAKGCIFGDGVGMVVLKRLSDALEDGDTIHTVIKGSAINNDGSLKVSYTAPGVAGQSEVITAALQQSDVEAESISYIEAHGTATELGDPIEVAALTKAYRKQTDATNYCALGSVKTNVGHLDRAAGVVGLMKTVLALKHEEIPPSLHFESPNPEIDFAHSPFYVNTELTPWPRSDLLRRAGVNSLGMGGTNAHMIVEEAPMPQPSGPSRPYLLLLLSARTATALQTATANLRTYLQRHPDIPLADSAYTLQIGRKRFAYRQAIVCRNHTEAISALEADTQRTPYLEERTERPVVFLFPGLGEQYARVARTLYQHEPVFRDVFDSCCTFLHSHTGIDLRDALSLDEPDVSYASNGHHLSALESASNGRQSIDLRALLAHNHTHTSELEHFKETVVAQPTLFIIEYALAKLLHHWGVRPQAMLGYSLGEYVAACLAGVLSLEDALKLVAQRAQLIQKSSGGLMLAVAFSEHEVTPYLNEQLSLAAINGPTTCVLAGTSSAIERLESHLTQLGIAHRRVETTRAFHSALLAPLRGTLTEMIGSMKLRAPDIPYISNVTGTWITAEQATDPAYWAEHMCQPVRFAEGLEHILQEKDAALIEVGPGQALGSFVKQHPSFTSERIPLVVSTLPAAYENQPAHAHLLTSLGRLWSIGVSIDWQGFYAQERRRRIPLPTYPFERQRYWIEHHEQPLNLPPADPISLKREPLANWFYLPCWQQSAPPIASNDTQMAGEQHHWLFFLNEWDEQALGQRIVELLRVQQQDITVVVPGEAFRRHAAGIYTVSISQQADYEALFRELQDQGKTPDKIVHLWSVSRPAGTDPDEILNRSFYSLLFLAQAIGNLGLERCDMSIISNEVQDVTGDETLCPEKATLLGPCRVIPQEYAHVRCRSIDIVLSEAGSQREQVLLRLLLRELMTEPVDTVVALRGNHRWVQHFSSMRLDMGDGKHPGRGVMNPPSGSDGKQRGYGGLRHGGVYLITGGLGGLGLALAEYLVQTVQAHLVLVGRHGLPPREQWSEILETQGGRDDSQGISRQIRAVQQLEQQGTEVLVVSADVTNEKQMSQAFQQAIATFGTIHGIFHAAGIPGIGLMQLKTAQQAAQVLAPKVQGMRVIARLLAHYPQLSPDFLVLFSSIYATIGGPGQVDYCAANAFLDAYAHCHHAQHGMTLAIDWSEWQWNAWESGLAGYDVESQRFFKTHRQKFGITNHEGTEALGRILACPSPQVVVSTQEFHLLIAMSKTLTTTSVLQRTQQVRTKHPRPQLSSTYVPPRNDLERQVASVWEDLLGISPVGVNDNFFELGGNSLSGLDLIARLKKALNVEALAAYILYEAPSISALARYIKQGRTTVAIEERHERGTKRRESLKNRVRER